MPPRVYLCIPVYRQIYSHFLFPILQTVGENIQKQTLCGLETPMEKLIVQARNEACEMALSLDATHVWFIDDDVCVPPGALEKLLAASDDNTVVGGLYHNSEGDAVAYRSLDGPLKPYDPRNHVAEYEVVEVGKFRMLDAPVKVAALGMGCTLIPTALLRRMAFPWFHTEYRPAPESTRRPRCVAWVSTPDSPSYREDRVVNQSSTYEFVGEDIWFFEQLQRVAGARVLLHCGVRCGHLKQESK